MHTKSDHSDLSRINSCEAKPHIDDESVVFHLSGNSEAGGSPTCGQCPENGVYGAILLYQNDQIWKTLKGESIQLQAPSTSRLLGCHSFPENSFCSSACCDIANESHQFRHICSMRLVLGYLKLNQHLSSVTDCARFDQVTVNRSMAERIWVPLGSSEVWISIELKGNLQLKKKHV